MKDICKFCEGIEKDRIILETSEWIAFYDAYPVSKGHALLVSKEHFNTFFDLPPRLYDSMMFRIQYIKYQGIKEIVKILGVVYVV